MARIIAKGIAYNFCDNVKIVRIIIFLKKSLFDQNIE